MAGAITHYVLLNTPFIYHDGDFFLPLQALTLLVLTLLKDKGKKYTYSSLYRTYITGERSHPRTFSASKGNPVLQHLFDNHLMNKFVSATYLVSSETLDRIMKDKGEPSNFTAQLREAQEASDNLNFATAAPAHATRQGLGPRPRS